MHYSPNVFVAPERDVLNHPAEKTGHQSHIMRSLDLRKKGMKVLNVDRNILES
jgi:hypothetical protein